MQPLRRTPLADHDVVLYDGVDELSAAAVPFLAEGFAAGEPALVLATPDHRAALSDGLREGGLDPVQLERQGRLMFADAEDVLASILVAGELSPERFEQVVEGLLDTVAAGSEQRPRVFGELVDLLSSRDAVEAADALEELWNRLGAHRPFSLLCGYRVDVFDRDLHVGLLPQVCGTHAHVLAAGDSDRLRDAVDAALVETLGPADAHKVYALVGQRIHEARVPSAHLALMWVSAHMPRAAERVLASARTHYVHAARG